jgi:sulfate permease, SulP family
MPEFMKFNRMELSGSLGDLGTILPLAVGMIMINDLSAMGVFLCVGLFYITSGLYYQVTCPVEPMKVISAYAISTGITNTQIQASTLWLFIILFILGATGLVTGISRMISREVVRGVQLSTGIMLVNHGISLMLGSSSYQVVQSVAEPNLNIQSLAGFPIGVIIGVSLGILTLLLLDNKKIPAALTIVSIGLVIGVLFGQNFNISADMLGFYFPEILPYGIPGMDDLSFAVIILVLPQIPMTIGNAVMANADLSSKFFPENGGRVTHKALCLGMALANLGSYFLGGMPMCQGAGGLASRYRFGARTAGSNVIIGSVFLSLVFFLGPNLLNIINIIPLSVLGVLLLFAGTQLALTIIDLKTRKELFIPIVMMGVTLASNLAAGFIAGVVLAFVLKWEKLKI